jgi:hypothetical protein
MGRSGSSRRRGLAIAAPAKKNIGDLPDNRKKYSR